MRAWRRSIWQPPDLWRGGSGRNALIEVRLQQVINLLEGFGIEERRAIFLHCKVAKDSALFINGNRNAGLITFTTICERKALLGCACPKLLIGQTIQREFGLQFDCALNQGRNFILRKLYRCPFAARVSPTKSRQMMNKTHAASVIFTCEKLPPRQTSRCAASAAYQEMLARRYVLRLHNSTLADFQ